VKAGNNRQEHKPMQAVPLYHAQQLLAAVSNTLQGITHIVLRCMRHGGSRSSS